MTLRSMTNFATRQEGSISIFGLFMLISCAIIGGLGLDVMSAMNTRTKLQVAADSAAHAALMARQDFTEAEAQAIGVAIAQMALPPSKYGNTILPSDIRFGTWDAANDVFTDSPGTDDAVLVSTQNLNSRGNAMGTFFLRFVGMGSLDVVSESVFETYVPTCFREGFVAEDVVDVQSNNTYGNGFCIHSNDHVEINNGNTFMDGTIVSMPDKRDMVVPTSSDPTSNPGLDDALRDGSYQLRILQRIDDIIAGVEQPNSPYYRTDYVTVDPVTGSPPPSVNLNSKTGGGVGIADWVPGAVHRLDCASNKKQVQWGNPDDVFTKGIVITNCIIKFAQGVVLEDVIMVNTNDDIDSFNSASSFTLGRDDGCNTGGGAQLVTKGGVNFAADFQAYGGQIVAAKTIQFSARNDGIEGISLVSGMNIDGSSLINVGFCGGSGMDNNFVAWYFRMAT